VVYDNFSRDGLAFRLLWICSFLFPLGMGTIDHWTSSLFYIFFLISIWSLRKNWTVPQQNIKFLLLAFSIYFIVSVISLVNTEDIDSGIRRLEKMLFLLCFIPSYLAAQRLKIDLATPFLFGVLAAGPVFAGIAFNSVYYGDLLRAQAAYSPIIFGNMAMLNALLVLAAFFAGRLAGWRSSIGFIAFSASLYAAMLSGSRGAWLALPIVGVFLLWVVRRRLVGWAKGAVLVLVLVACVFAIHNDRIYERVTIVGKNVAQFMNDKEENTSEGVRIMLWQLAWSVWQEKPLLGTGIGDFRYETKKKLAEGQTALEKDYGHAHNIFLDALATTGMLGFLAFVVSFFVLPAHIFWTIGLARGTLQMHFSVLAGLTLLVSFAVFGLTEGWMARSPMLSVFLFGLLVFLSSSSRGETHA
jgi:O-antigen ligase